jgi:hypothetical protein
MTAVLIYGFTVGDFAMEGKQLLSMPWGIVSLVDLYVGFVFRLDRLPREISGPVRCLGGAHDGLGILDGQRVHAHCPANQRRQLAAFLDGTKVGGVLALVPSSSRALEID